MSRILSLFGAALVSALLVGCAGGGATAPAPAASAGGADLDFTVPAVGGGQVEGGELAGRDLALWFWAPW
jgi:hypothetical protein